MSETLERIENDTIFERTALGQQELMVGSRLLSRTERRLLAVVTGLTSISVLMDLCIDPVDLQVAFAHLVELGLVQPVRAA